MAEVALRSSVDSLEDLDASALPLAAACREAMDALPAPSPAARAEAMLPSWRELAQAPRKKVQKLLSKRLDEKDYSLLLGKLDAPDAVRLRSCGCPFAAGWLLASPGQTEEVLDDRD